MFFIYLFIHLFLKKEPRLTLQKYPLTFAVAVDMGKVPSTNKVVCYDVY